MIRHQKRLHTARSRWAWLAASLLLAVALLTACAPTGAASAPHPSATAKRPMTTATVSPTPSDPTVRQTFENGMAFPRWGLTVYGVTDTWAQDVAAMQAQTHAQWVEMTVSLSQNGVSGTNVFIGANSSSPDDLYVGVTNARAAGLKVYLKPLLNVLNDPTTTWSGDVTLSSHAAAQQWFQSYWAAYKPYVKAAASAGVSQVSIGTEFSLLQAEYPDQWHWLLQQVSGVFHGPITYELNHDTIVRAPDWLSDSHLAYIGVSEYDSLQTTPQDISTDQIEQLWRQNIIPLLDHLSAQMGKPVLLSEVGYRDTADCLTDPWISQTSAPADPSLQGAAYAAAIAVAKSDQHIAGIYFWAWQNGQFSPDQPAIAAMRAAYSA